MKAGILSFITILFAASCARPTRQAAVAPPHATSVQEAEGARRFYLMQRLPEGATELPVEPYIEARKHIAAMPRIPVGAGAGRPGVHADDAGSATTSGWTSLGPGNIGGRTRSLVINPQNPSIMYAGAVTGGVWQTNDAGKSWAPLFDSQQILNIGTMVMDPTDPNTIYAGTGEWFASFQGDGIYKTSNGGQSWQPLGSTTNSSFYYVNKLVISPNDHLRLYAATWSGVWTSPDGGNTWSQIFTTKTAFYGCQDLAIRPDMNPDVVFASCSGATSSADYQIVRNVNAGAPGTTWVVVQTQPSMGRTSLAIAPSQPDTIYALAADYDSASPFIRGLLAVYRSTSGGDAGTWTAQVTNTDSNPTNSLLLNDVRDSTSAYCTNGAPVAPASGQGNYDNLIAVDPLNPNTVWVGGIEVFRSDDGGRTWGIASLWQVPYGNAQFAHADRHVIAFHPNYDGAGNQTLYLGSDGGIFRTDNARAAVATGPQAVCLANFEANSAIRWTNLNNSYTATQFYHGFAYPGGMAYMGGAQDNSVSRGTDLGGINGWALFSTGDGTSVAIDPFDANHTLESKQNLSLSRAIDGETFVGSVAGITETSASFPFVPPLAMDPNQGNALFLGGTTNLWRSLNGGGNWTAAAPVEAKGAVNAIAVSPVDSNTVLFGTTQGFIYRNNAALSSDGVTTWASSRPRNTVVSGITFDPTNPQIVYASYSPLLNGAAGAHVYKSMDGGVTWSPLSGSAAASLPDTPVFKLVVNPYTPSTLYLGSDLGVFVSTDGGATWGHDPNEFSNVVVEDLALDSVSQPNWLFAFTYGRGLYRTPLPGSPAPNCTYSVSPTTISADAYGSVVPVRVSAPAGCAWSGIPGALPSVFQVQSPAQGWGSGAAYVNIEPNTAAARTDVLDIANTAVTVSQAAAGTLTRTIGDLATAPVAFSVPGTGVVSSAALTSSSTDPLHSCTGSSDFRTGWFMVTPGVSGTLQIQAAARRLDVYGNAGISIAAYAAANTNSELACALVPQDTTSQIDGMIRFSVAAGASYLVEVSALGNAASYNASILISATMASSADATVSISPASATLTAGASPAQFNANVANVANNAVRWSISPPVGSVSPSGVYTPPASLPEPVAGDADGDHVRAAAQAGAGGDHRDPGRIWHAAAAGDSVGDERGQCDRRDRAEYLDHDHGHKSCAEYAFMERLRYHQCADAHAA